MKTRIILTSALFAAIAVVQTGCESKKKAEAQYKADSLRDDKVTYDTTFKAEEIAEPVLAKSEQHFNAAVAALDRKDYERAKQEIARGVAAIRVEGKQDKGELKTEFEKSVSNLEKLEKLAGEKKLTSADLKKGFWPAEMMVTHYAIEKWENMPEFDVKANDHLRETLDGLERKTADIETSAKDEGKKLIGETRTSLKTAEQTAATDTKKAKADIKIQTAKLKAYIKKNI